MGKKKSGGFLRGLLITVLVFAVLFGAVLRLMDMLGSTSDAEQLSIVSESVRHALLTCYAVEGGYPESLDYLKENYGLMYDADRVMIDYDAFASNIMPQVRVTLRGDDDGR